MRLLLDYVMWYIGTCCLIRKISDYPYWLSCSPKLQHKYQHNWEPDLFLPMPWSFQPVLGLMVSHASTLSSLASASQLPPQFPHRAQPPSLSTSQLSFQPLEQFLQSSSSSLSYFVPLNWREGLTPEPSRLDVTPTAVPAAILLYLGNWMKESDKEDSDSCTRQSTTARLLPSKFSPTTADTPGRMNVTCMLWSPQPTRIFSSLSLVNHRGQGTIGSCLRWLNTTLSDHWISTFVFIQCLGSRRVQWFAAWLAVFLTFILSITPITVEYTLRNMLLHTGTWITMTICVYKNY